MLTPNQFDKWITALRSNTYLQGRYALKRGNCYCVLGICADVNKEDFKVEWIDWQGHASLAIKGASYEDECQIFECRLPYDLIPTTEQNSLIKLNDQFCLSLPELADYLERNKTAFTESAPPSIFP